MKIVRFSRKNVLYVSEVSLNTCVVFIYCLIFTHISVFEYYRDKYSILKTLSKGISKTQNSIFSHINCPHYCIRYKKHITCNNDLVMRSKTSCIYKIKPGFLM
jgi:hypothetical protein